MKTCLLNLPYPARVMRRYNCTYYAPNFLFPPLELMYLGSVIKQWKKGDCILIDAIAEKLNLDKVVNRLKRYQPDSLVFMAGVETFKEDLQKVKTIKSNFPQVKIGCIGYLPSLFPKETLENNPAMDYIIMNEPEISFSELYDCLKEGRRPDSLPGITYRDDGKVCIGKDRERIKDLDRLPFPDRSLIKQKYYNEFLLKRPFGTIQTSRGCPFECTFCIRTYGREAIYRSPENILAEIEELILKYGVRAIRFMDDTFTLSAGRLIKICEGIASNGLDFDWSCLSRVDALMNKDTLALMRKAGCRRIYLGIETGSQRLLEFYRKGYRADCIKEQVGLIKGCGIEAVGFFIVGGIQTDNEFKNDIKLAKDLQLDYIVVEKLTSYPGTQLFNYTKGMNLEGNALRWERVFYRSFYFRPQYLLPKLGHFILNIKDSFSGARRLLKSLFVCRNHPSRREMI